MIFRSCTERVQAMFRRRILNFNSYKYQFSIARVHQSLNAIPFSDSKSLHYIFWNPSSSQQIAGFASESSNGMVVQPDDILRSNADKIFEIVSNSGSELTMRDALTKSGVAFTPKLVVKVLKRARFSHGNGFRALQFFQWCAETFPGSVSHSADAYDQMIFILARMRKFDKVWEIMREMQRKDSKLISCKTVQIVLARFAKVFTLKEALDAFEKLIRNYVPGELSATDAFNALLRAICLERNMEDARCVYHQLKSRFRSDTHTFNIILSGWRSSDDAMICYQEMIQLGCSPDIVTYNTLLDALCKSGKLKEAEQLLDEMREKECYPDRVTYTTLIAGLGSVGRHDDGYKMLKEMAEFGCFPDAAAYNALIKSLCMASRCSHAFRLLKEMESKGIPPNPNTYNNFIRYYYRSGDWEEASTVFRRMMATKCYPRTQTCMLLMRLACKHERLDMALQLWNDMIAKGYGSYSEVLDVLMAGLCDSGKLDEAEKCFFQTVEKGHTPSLFSYKRLRALLELTNRQETIKVISEKMRSINLS